MSAFVFPFSRRGKIDGDLVRLQVHRDICRHQSQRGRAAGRHPHADTPQAGESREIARLVPQAQLLEAQSQSEQIHRHLGRGNADGQRAQHAEEVPRLTYLRQLEGEKPVGEGVGAR